MAGTVRNGRNRKREGKEKTMTTKARGKERGRERRKERCIVAVFRKPGPTPLMKRRKLWSLTFGPRPC